MTAAAPADPVLDVALSHALLDDVAAGRRGDTLRVFRPGPTLAFGRLDALRPGFRDACAVARRHGFTPLVRSVGGRAAVYDERCLAVEHITAAADVTAGLQARFAALSGGLRRVLAGLGADARVGALPGEYCPGAHSINVGGRFKVAGIAQRTVRGGAMTSAVVVVSGGADVRSAVAAVYGALGIDVDPATAGSLDEALPGVAVEEVAGAVRDAFGRTRRLEPRELDPELISAARALEPRHAAP
jgi:lipoate-protein ligase A